MMPATSDENAVVRALSQSRTKNHLDQPSVPLPNELLRQIFRCALGDLVVSVSEDELGDTPGALYLGQTLIKNHFRSKLPFRLAAVCRRWRLVSLDTAELWTWICESDQRGRMRSEQHLQTLLSRARSAPLDVFINKWTFDGGPMWPCDVITAAAGAHWRALCLSIPPDLDAGPISALLSCHAPALEYLLLECDCPGRIWREGRAGRSQAGPFSIILGSQRLQHLQMRDCCIEDVRVRTLTKLPPLIYLSLDCVDIRPYSLWLILSAAENLQSMRMHEVSTTTNYTWTPPAHAVLRLPCLQRLDIGNRGTEPIILAQWARHLETPCVEFLEAGNIRVPDLLTLAPCVAASLRHLWYLWYDDEYRDLRPVFSALPHLHVLELSHNNVEQADANLFRAMATDAILPELEKLAFRGLEICWSDDPDSPDPLPLDDESVDVDFAKAVLDFVRARSSPRQHAHNGKRTAQLKVIEWDYYIESALLAGLREHVTVPYH